MPKGKAKAGRSPKAKATGKAETELKRPAAAEKSKKRPAAAIESGPPTAETTEKTEEVPPADPGLFLLRFHVWLVSLVVHPVEICVNLSRHGVSKKFYARGQQSRKVSAPYFYKRTGKWAVKLNGKQVVEASKHVFSRFSSLSFATLVSAASSRSEVSSMIAPL